MTISRVMQQVGAALLGLRAPSACRPRVTLTPTPGGIVVQLAPSAADPEPTTEPVTIDAEPTPLDLVPDRAAGAVVTGAPMHRLRQADADLHHRSPLEHAQSLLVRLQSDPDTVGAVVYEVVADCYADMLIDLGWAPRPWNVVSRELRRLSGARKRYLNRDGGKVLVFDIPDSSLAEVIEADWASSEHREAA